METNAPETDSRTDSRTDSSLRAELRPVFRLAILTSEGRVDRSGIAADSPDVALEIGDVALSKYDVGMEYRLAVIREDRLPGTWTDAKGNAHARYAAPVVVCIVAGPDGGA